MASIVGKGKSIIGNYENNVSEPSIEVMIKYSNYFGIHIGNLLTEDLTILSESEFQKMRANMRSIVGANSGFSVLNSERQETKSHNINEIPDPINFDVLNEPSEHNNEYFNRVVNFQRETIVAQKETIEAQKKTINALNKTIELLQMPLEDQSTSKRA